MEKINIVELLKDCPSGMELDCTMYENVYFDKIYDEDCLYQIGCYTINDGVRNSINFTKYGKFNTTRIAKCVIFPKGKTTWEGFQRPFKVGDIIQDEDGYKVKITEVNIEDECYGYESMIAKGIGSISFSEQDNWELVLNKFDITTLKPFESRILVRVNENGLWKPAIFGFYNKIDFYTVSGIAWEQCIPYEGNEHLLGTTNDCDEFYKTW